MSKRKLIKQIVDIETEYGMDPDIDRLKELDIQELEDILRSYPESGFEAKAKTTPKKTVKVKGGGMIRKFASGGAALRGFGKVIK